jgi:hypothetical protein
MLLNRLMPSELILAGVLRWLNAKPHAQISWLIEKRYFVVNLSEAWAYTGIIYAQMA